METNINSQQEDRGADQYRRYSVYLNDRREQERKAMARAIHDELGQLLTAVKMDLFWFEENIPNKSERVSKRLDDTIHLINLTIASVHDVVSQLRPSVLDDMGIVEAVRWQVKEFQKRQKIECVLTVPDEDVVLNPERATAVFRIFQDVLDNIVRHAHATHVHVNIAKHEGDVMITVEDNGKGISEEDTQQNDAFGLMSMRERAWSQGGAVEFRKNKQQGTGVVIRMPLAEEQG